MLPLVLRRLCNHQQTMLSLVNQTLHRKQQFDKLQPNASNRAHSSHRRLQPNQFSAASSNLSRTASITTTHDQRQPCITFQYHRVNQTYNIWSSKLRAAASRNSPGQQITFRTTAFPTSSCGLQQMHSKKTSHSSLDSKIESSEQVIFRNIRSNATCLQQCSGIVQNTAGNSAFSYAGIVFSVGQTNIFRFTKFRKTFIE